jgi:hypothetical protein
MTVPTTERTTSGVKRLVNAFEDDRRRLERADGLGPGARRRVANRQTSTTTGKTIGRRLVCS